MKITKSQLKKIIKEEVQRINESPDYVYGMITDYEDWVKAKGHITSSASSVMATYILELGFEGDTNLIKMLADHFDIDPRDVKNDIKLQLAELDASRPVRKGLAGSSYEKTLSDYEKHPEWFN